VGLSEIFSSVFEVIQKPCPIAPKATFSQEIFRKEFFLYIFY
jgi:hypothetical protein